MCFIFLWYPVWHAIYRTVGPQLPILCWMIENLYVSPAEIIGNRRWQTIINIYIRGMMCRTLYKSNSESNYVIWNVIVLFTVRNSYSGGKKKDLGWKIIEVRTWNFQISFSCSFLKNGCAFSLPLLNSVFLTNDFLTTEQERRFAFQDDLHSVPSFKEKTKKF